MSRCLIVVQVAEAEMSSSQAGASGAGAAPGSTGPGRTITPRAGRFLDLSQAHSAILGRSNQGANSSGEALAVEQQGEEELGPAGSTTDSLGEIVGAYAPTETVGSRSVSQHTATLYKLEGHVQARQDGAANPVLAAEEEEDDDDSLPEELEPYGPPRARLPRTPPTFRRGHRRANEVSGPSPSSVANSEGLLADTPPPLPVVPAAFVQVPVGGQNATTVEDLLRGSWLSLPGPDVGPSGLAKATKEQQQQQQHEDDDDDIDEHDDAFLGQSSASLDETVTAMRLRQAASTTFSQSPTTTPGRPHHHQQQHHAAMPVVSSRPRPSQETSSPGFSYGSAEAHSSTDQIVHHAAPHAGTSLSAAATGPFVAGSRELSRLRPSAYDLANPFNFDLTRAVPSSQDPSQHGPYGSSVASSSRDGAPFRGRFPGNPTPSFPRQPLAFPSSSLRPPFGRGISPLAAALKGNLKYEFRDSMDSVDLDKLASGRKSKNKEVASRYDEKQAISEKKRKGKEVASPYERLEEDDHNDQYFGFNPEPSPPPQLTQPAPALRRPTVSTLAGESIHSHDSQFSFPLIDRDEAIRLQAERHARGDFGLHLIERTNPRSSNRDPSSSSQVPSSTPGGPLTNILKLYQKRKPVATAGSSTSQRPSRQPIPAPGSLTYQLQRDLTRLYTADPTAARQEQELGPEAIPTSPLGFASHHGPHPSRPTLERIGSYEIFNSDVNPSGDLIPRQTAPLSHQTAASTLGPMIDYSRARSHTQRIRDQAVAELEAKRRGESYELSNMPLQPRPIPPGERWEDVSLADPTVNSNRFVNTLAEVVPVPDRRA